MDLSQLRFKTFFVYSSKFLFFSAFDIFVRNRGRMRVVPLRGQRLADAPVAVGSALAPAYLPLRLRLHARGERCRNRGREQPTGRSQQAGQIGRSCLRSACRSFHPRGFGLAQEPNGRG